MLPLSDLQTPQKNQFYILDIDSTLLTTHQRNQAILEAFIKEKKKDFPEDCQQLSKVKCQLGDYGYFSALDRASYQAVNSKAPEALKAYWHKHFFSNDFLNYDVPVPGAVSWVQGLKSFEIPFVYLTARHKELMWDGTLSSLKALGFPISEKNLFLKENLNDSDEVYKSKTMKKVLSLHPKNQPILIDNEPMVLHQILKDFPNIELVWFNSTHSGKKQPPSEALAINNFDF